MAIVTKTIGTSSRDYSTVAAWEADLDSGAIYSSADDAVGEMYADSTFTDSNVNINGGATIGLNSITLQAAEGERHDGTAGTGVVWTDSGTGRIVQYSSALTGYIRWIEFDSNSTRQTQAIYLNPSTSNHIYFSNNLVHDIEANVGVSTYAVIELLQDNTHLSNNIIYECENIHASATQYTGIRQNSSGDWTDIWNTTVHRIGCTSGGATGIQCQNGENSPRTNCIVTDTHGGGTTKDYGSVISGVTYSLSSDSTLASGTGNLQNKSAANQYVSTTGGSEDLHLKTGSDAIGAGDDIGTTPTHVNIDINGFDRDSIAIDWDMGAHQFVTEVPENYYVARRLSVIEQGEVVGLHAIIEGAV